MEDRREFVKKVGLATGALGLLGSTTLLALNRQSYKINPIKIVGKVTDGRKGIAQVAVSDGETVVVTDKNGDFEFWSTGNQPFVFVSIPSGFKIKQQSNGSAIFFASINPNQNKNRILFQLDRLPVNDNSHSFLVLADPQIQDDYEVQQLLNTSAPDVIETIRHLDDPNTFGIGCGDLVFDRLDLLDDYDRAIRKIQIPFFQVIGNHDMDLDARSDEFSANTFNKKYGPTYYSFNRGQIHYVVLDDVFFTGEERGFIGYLTEMQLAWLEQDLANVPKGSTVVISAHIPIHNLVKNRMALIELLAPFKVHILSGHTHRNDNYVTSSYFEHCHGTVCGAWWSGPICGDGTPNGYGVYNVNGSGLDWYYKSVGKAKDHQFRYYQRGSLKEFPNSCVLNVWNYDPAWNIAWYENGERKTHIRKIRTVDPLSVELHLGKEIPERRGWVEPYANDHMFLFEPDDDVREITIEVEDRFGNVYVESVKVG
ncbi:calcineurin-like phosphoesterase C-terminal domain-containing protein [Allomuricauda sp. CP2A]|jgi:hypothetical protein|uniref:calcineurin-like phosphoesterase C-terminal domain-containing protein n=1 Tax=Allomuricauda sp. CP2A TaxID=1848189 RepID=UPI000829F66E|nr:calcineurin-like phosphoesterase family protein [Muricauda sp. CP2A]